MKILVHDYAGHPFQPQLARALARMGHQVVFASFRDIETPKGRVRAGVGEPGGFTTIEIAIEGTFQKDNLWRRYLGQLKYAKKVRALVLAERPDVVLSSNAPIEVQESLMTACHTVEARFVFWVQDIHAEAIERVLGKKNRWLGIFAGYYYRRKEKRLLRDSDGVVVISQAFLDVFSSPRWGLDVREMVVIENWANMDDIAPLPRDNDWAVAHMADRARIVYSGTLARKHDPDLLLELARKCDADIYLFSQGKHADYVDRQSRLEGLGNVFVRPWVDVETLSKMLAGADILFAVIEADAGVFSVPSKVLTYLAAGRAILASIPLDNLSAQSILREEAGLVSAPGDLEMLIAHAEKLLSDAKLRKTMGENGRSYAERAFDIDRITERFVEILGVGTQERHQGKQGKPARNG